MFAAFTSRCVTTTSSSSSSPSRASYASSPSSPSSSSSSSSSSSLDRIASSSAVGAATPRRHRAVARAVMGRASLALRLVIYSKKRAFERKSSPCSKRCASKKVREINPTTRAPRDRRDGAAHVVATDGRTDDGGCTCVASRARF